MRQRQVVRSQIAAFPLHFNIAFFIEDKSKPPRERL